LIDASGDVDDAKIAVDDANFALEEARSAVETASYTVDDARANLEDAQAALNEANSLSPIITAPFDGFIPQISIKGGDEVLKGTVAMQIAAADKFEAEIAVSEIDISQVGLGGKALVEVDALGVTLPATVTYIAPTATVQSGVVNYEVTVEVQSLAAAASEMGAAADNTTGLPPAITDNATLLSPAGMQSIAGQANSLENEQLKAGMTVTVNLIVSERQDALLMPYSAITAEGPQKYVQVLAADGSTEKRAITTGITDYSFIEVTGGLTEGEQVLITAATTTAKSTASADTQQSGGGIMIPGISGGPPPGGPQ
jgi:hypothetical protein